MAKGCVYFDILEHIGGHEWQSLLEKPFRASLDDAQTRFDMFKSTWRGGRICLSKIMTVDDYDPAKKLVDIFQDA